MQGGKLFCSYKADVRAGQSPTGKAGRPRGLTELGPGKRREVIAQVVIAQLSKKHSGYKVVIDNHFFPNGDLVFPSLHPDCER